MQARRFLCAVLTLALAHFGVVATEPAHAHEVEASEDGLAVMLHGHGIGHHGHDDHLGDRDHDGRALGEAPADASTVAGDDGADTNGARTVLHVHCCPHLAPADPGAEPSSPVAVALRLRSPSVSSGSPGTWATPFRPPRTFL